MNAFAIRNVTVFPVSRDPIEDGTVVVEGKRIAAVGKNVRIPKDAKVVDGKGGSLLPGFIDAHTHLGIGGETLGPRFGSGNETPEPVQPHLRALDAIWHDDPAFAEVLAAGVTAAWVCPGSVNVFGGVGVALKTRPGTVDDRRLPGSEGMKMALGENVTRVHTLAERYPTTRMGVAALARETLFDAVRYARKRETGDEGIEPSFKMEALMPLVTGTMPARIHAHRADDIMTALRLAEEFSLRLVIEHCTEGFLVAETLAERGVAAVVGPHLGGRSKPETARRTLANAALLHRAGVKVALQTDAGSGVQFLPVHAAMAMREGLPEDAALRAITLSPAEILGVDDRLGSIDPGKDADLVLLPGAPLDVSQKPLAVWCEGVCVEPQDR